jgi:hypothetical protein
MGCADTKGARAGDIIIVGWGGDDPDTAIERLLARHRDPSATQPAWPTRFLAGHISRYRRGSGVVEFRTADGRRHPIRAGLGGVTHYRYAQLQQLRRGVTPQAAVDALSRSNGYTDAMQRLLTMCRPQLRRCEHTDW